MVTKTSVFAVFIDKNKVAGTTRPEDPTALYGLPGGKVDEGEDFITALIRECNEEGWDISQANINKFHEEYLDNGFVTWYSVDNAVKLTEYKELYRGIKPVMVDISYFLNDTRYGNSCISKLN